MKKFIAFLFICAAQNMFAFQIYSDHAGFFDTIWTKNDFRFLMIEVVSIATSIHFLYKTEGVKAPEWYDILISVFVNTSFIVIVYQWAIDENVSLWVPMILSFFLGTFGFVMLDILRTKVPSMTVTFFNDVYLWAKEKFFPSKT